MKLSKKLLITGFSIAALALSGCSKTKTADEGLVDTWPDIESKGEVVMGLDDTFAPMGFRDASGNLVGFDVDLATEVANRIGIAIKFQPIDWSLKETELQSGNIDLIWNGYTITPAREEKVAFTEPYLENSQIIVTLADSPINSKADLEGKSVAVQKESSAYEAVMADTAFVDALGQDLIQFDTNNEAFMDLEAKRVDAIVVDEVLARYYMKLRGEEQYKVLEDNFGDELYGIGIRKGDVTLLEKVNKAMADMKADGTYDTIKNKWFSHN